MFSPASTMHVDQAHDPQPHQLANELTSDSQVQHNTAVPDTRRDPASPRVERSVARFVAPIVLAALVIGLLVAAALWRQWTLALIAAVFVVPFLLLVSAPVWLAGATKVAQDETVREQSADDTRDLDPVEPMVRG
jgi:hypothetical protein